MQEHKPSENLVVTARDFSQTTYVEVEPNSSSPNQVHVPRTVGIWESLSLITGIIFLVFLLSKIHKPKQDDIVVNLQQLNKIPCSNCRFFSSNPYLKCAVNPAIALTEAAIDCSDYCPQPKKTR